MNNTTKEFIDEIIACKKGEPSGKYLRPVEKHIDKKELFGLNALLLSWIHEYKVNNDKYSSMKLSDILYHEYKAYFEHCATLGSIFTLHKDKVAWNDGLSDDEIKEITMYVWDNFKMRLISTFRKK